MEMTKEELLKLSPGEIYDFYYDILNLMDFTPDEAERIAYKNAKEMLKQRSVVNEQGYVRPLR